MPTGVAWFYGRMGTLWKPLASTSAPCTVASSSLWRTTTPDKGLIVRDRVSCAVLPPAICLLLRTFYFIIWLSFWVLREESDCRERLWRIGWIFFYVRFLCVCVCLGSFFCVYAFWFKGMRPRRDVFVTSMLIGPELLSIMLGLDLFKRVDTQSKRNL